MSDLNLVDFYQYSREVSNISEIEWEEIRSIARECYKANLFKGNQFKIAIEAFSRWAMLQDINENLDQEIKEIHSIAKH